jgi:hypothetical protein
MASVRDALQFLRSVKFAEVFCCFHVTPCPASDVVLLVEAERTPDFSGRTEDERARGNFRSQSDEGVSADNGTCAHFNIVENDGAHPDKDLIVDLAWVDDGAVTDRNQFAHCCRIIRVEVDDGIVLNVRARPDYDTVDVAAQYGAVPNARLFCQGDIANYCCAGNDPGTWMDRGSFI